jgi:hypothetical protein
MAVFFIPSNYSFFPDKLRRVRSDSVWLANDNSRLGDEMQNELDNTKSELATTKYELDL